MAEGRVAHGAGGIAQSEERMGVREKIARVLAPGLKGTDEVRDIVKDEVRKARMALPITANYDPNNEGYRPMTGQAGQRRTLLPIDVDRMLDVAYWAWDHSAMIRGLALIDKAFLFGEPITVTSDEGALSDLLTEFWKRNKVAQRFPDKIMWLSLLGMQCWPARVNKFNGEVNLTYVDPQNIKDIHVLPADVETVSQIELKGVMGRSGQKMAAIRKDRNFRSKTNGRLVGDCFFWAINHPPNDPWGRSDFLTLFDWVDGLERYGYNFLERAEFMLNFVWDVLLKGMDENEITQWLRDNPAPEPGSVRAHNEHVEWKAVAPDLKAPDASKGFEMGKSFIMGAARRPDSWFGSGGKAYQTEAEQFGQVPIKDLDERQQYYKFILEEICEFVVDQAVIAGRITEEKAAAGFTVNTPEISKKDFSKLISAVPQFATALSIAEGQGWVRKEDAIELFSLVVSQLGMEVDAEAVLKEMGEKDEGEGDRVTEDYKKIIE